VRQWFPKLFVLYRRVLFDRAFRENYTRELDARIAAAAESAGLSSRLA
jgi:hypothetical protein